MSGPTMRLFQSVDSATKVPEYCRDVSLNVNSLPYSYCADNSLQIMAVQQTPCFPVFFKVSKRE